MPVKDYSGVIIDGALPRSKRDRCEAIFGYLIAISEYGPHQEWDPAAQTIKGPENDAWIEFEDELTSEIQRLLPKGYLILGGEQTPGDVVVVFLEDE